MFVTKFDFEIELSGNQTGQISSDFFTRPDPFCGSGNLPLDQSKIKEHLNRPQRTL